jgi:GNAT superfamily N-acetyltransferase
MVASPAAAAGTARSCERIRPAAHVDLDGLADLERSANLAALAHVFPPDRYPFPFDAVRARWRDVLTDPDCRVDVVDQPCGRAAAGGASASPALAALVAYDQTRLRHLAVHPARFGDGLAVTVLRHAEQQLRARGAATARLWVLAANQRARRFYEREGWRPDGRQHDCEWPPYPTELGYRRDLSVNSADRP